jgi:ribosomal protein L17
MRHNVMGRQLGRTKDQRKSLFRNLATELFRHKKIKTTEAKARAIQPIAEKLIPWPNAEICMLAGWRPVSCMTRLFCRYFLMKLAPV